MDRLLGRARADRKISLCSASALRPWDAASCFSAKAISSSTFRTIKFVAMMRSLA
jgi:hypothetical protein